MHKTIRPSFWLAGHNGHGRRRAPKQAYLLQRESGILSNMHTCYAPPSKPGKYKKAYNIVSQPPPGEEARCLMRNCAADWCDR